MKNMKMKRLFAGIVFVLFMAVFAQGQTFNATYTFSNYVLQPQAVRQITLTPQQPDYNYTGAILAPIPITRVTDASGSYTYSNLVAGYSYTLELFVPPNRFFFTNNYPVGTTGTVNAATYTGFWVGQIFAYYTTTNFLYSTNTTFEYVTNIDNITNVFFITNNISGTNIYVDAGAGAYSTTNGTTVSINVSNQTFLTNGLASVAQLSATNAATLASVTNQIHTATNGFITAAAAALTYYPTSNPSGFVTASITNGIVGLATVAQLSATNAQNLIQTTNLVSAERSAMIATNLANLIQTTNLVAAERSALIATNAILVASIAAEHSAMIASNTIALTVATNLTAAERSALISTNVILLADIAAVQGYSVAVSNIVIVTSNALLSAISGTNAAVRAAIIATNNATLTIIIATNTLNLIQTTNLVAAERSALNATNSALLSSISNTNTQNLIQTTNLVAVERAALNATNSALLTAIANTNAATLLTIVAADTSLSNITAYLQAQIGNDTNYLVISAGGASAGNGTNKWSGTAFTNLNGVAFVTNDSAGTRIYISGISSYGTKYPAGTVWTNIGGFSPAPTSFFIKATNVAGANMTVTSAFGVTTFAASGGGSATNVSTTNLVGNVGGVLSGIITNMIFSAAGTNAILAMVPAGGGATNASLTLYTTNTAATVDAHITNSVADIRGAALAATNGMAASTGIAAFVSTNNFLESGPLGNTDASLMNGAPGTTITVNSPIQSAASANGNRTTNFDLSVGVTLSNLAAQVATSINIGSATNGHFIQNITGDSGIGVTISQNANGSSNAVLSLKAGTNFIADLNGNGTNTTLISGKNWTTTNLAVQVNTWLNGSNMFITISSNGIIPVMTESNLPSGLATASSSTGGFEAWRAFNGSGGPWVPSASDTNQDWIQYQFSSPVTISSMSFSASASGGPTLFQGSQDGITWSNLFSIALSGGSTITNYAPIVPYTGSYFRWSAVTNKYITNAGFIQLFNIVNLISNSVTLQIVSTNGGVAINAATANGYGLEVAGTSDATVSMSSPIGAFTNAFSSTNTTAVDNAQFVNSTSINSSGGVGAHQYFIDGNLISFGSLTNSVTQYFITNGLGNTTNFNGIYSLRNQSNSYAVYTNGTTNGYFLLTSAAWNYIGTNGYVLTSQTAASLSPLGYYSMQPTWNTNQLLVSVYSSTNVGYVTAAQVGAQIQATNTSATFTNEIQSIGQSLTNINSIVVRGKITIPFQSLTNAIANSQSGDVIVLQPGVTNWFYDSEYTFPANLAIQGVYGLSGFIASTNTRFHLSDNDSFNAIEWDFDVKTNTPSGQNWAFFAENTNSTSTNLTFVRNIFKGITDIFYIGGYGIADPTGRTNTFTANFSQCDFHSAWDTYVQQNTTNDYTMFSGCNFIGTPWPVDTSVNLFAGPYCSFGSMDYFGGTIQAIGILGSTTAGLILGNDAGQNTNKTINFFPSQVIAYSNSATFHDVSVGNKFSSILNIGGGVVRSRVQITTGGPNKIVVWPNFVAPITTNNPTAMDIIYTPDGTHFASSSNLLLAGAAQVNSEAVTNGLTVGGTLDVTGNSSWNGTATYSNATPLIFRNNSTSPPHDFSVVQDASPQALEIWDRDRDPAGTTNQILGLKSNGIYLMQNTIWGLNDYSTYANVTTNGAATFKSVSTPTITANSITVSNASASQFAITDGSKVLGSTLNGITLTNISGTNIVGQLTNNTTGSAGSVSAANVTAGNLPATVTNTIPRVLFAGEFQTASIGSSASKTGVGARGGSLVTGNGILNSQALIPPGTYTSIRVSLNCQTSIPATTNVYWIWFTNNVSTGILLTNTGPLTGLTAYVVTNNFPAMVIGNDVVSHFICTNTSGANLPNSQYGSWDAFGY